MSEHDAPSPEMTPQQRDEARRYGRLGLVCELADKAIDLGYLFLFALLLAHPFDAWLRQNDTLAASDTLRLIVLFLGMTLLHMLVSLPLSFYSGYWLEHRFGLSTLSVRGWVGRYLKRNALGLAFTLGMVVGLYWIIWTTGAWWWLVAALTFFAVSIILGQLLPVVILPLFYKVERLDAPELSERLARLAEGTGLSIEGVYRMDLSVETVKANAMLAGLGRTRRVLLGDTLLANFSPDEIEVIFAHEIGHHVHRHLPKMLAGGLVSSLLGLWLCDRVLWLTTAWPQPLDYASLPPATLPGLMLILSLFALASAPLQNAVSRMFERQCDRYALRRTRNRESFRSAFHKLARLNKDDPAPPRLEVIMLHSHPPIGERLALADEPLD